MPSVIQHNTNTKINVDEFAQQFERTFNSNRDPITAFSNENPAHYPAIKEINNITYFHSISEISNVIKTLPIKTSTGIDNIPSIALKPLPLLLVGECTIIFNNCINLGYYPSCWKTAKIIPLLKKGKNPNEPTSYRGLYL